MAKPRRRAMAAAVGLAALSLAPASRADWQITPRVELRETYTDNVLLQAREQARSQFVHELAPGLAVHSQGPRLDLHANYSKRLYKYADEDLGGANGARGNSQTLDAGLKARLLGESLFLEGAASISQQPVSAFGQLPIDNGLPGGGFSALNSNEIKTFRIAPYYVQRFGSAARAELRYERSRVSSDSSGFGTSDSNSVSFNLASGSAFRTVGWGLSYYRQDLSDSIAEDSNSSNLSASLNYLYSPQLTLSLTGGYDQYDYNAPSGKTKGASWSVGGTWTPSLRTRIQASVGKRYFGDSYSLLATHRGRASVWSINYSDAVTTTRSQFLLPSTVDTAALLDQMFMASIPDAAARRQAVLAYMQMAGLPPALANSVNYLSNRYMLQKQATASAAFNGARGTLLLSLFSARRNGLSSIDVDAGLLGGSNNTLNDNTRQTGANANATWRLSPRTGVNLSASRTRIRSQETGRADNNTAYRLSMTRQFANRINGSVEVRRVKGATAVAGRDYTENAVSASLSKQF